MTRKDPSAEKRDALRRCPICGKAADETVAPFCSTRCADVDLHRWLSGTYAIPSEVHESGEEDED